MKKNLLYIFADQWRKTAIGFEGQEPVKTPHIDQFSSESLVFDNAISTYPLCSPHRAALLTGKYPYSCGMWTNCKTGLDEVLMLKPQEVTMGNVLKDSGYQTAYIGKWHLDASEENFVPHPRSGAKGWDAYTPPGPRRQGFDYWYSYGAMDMHMKPHYWETTEDKIVHNKWSPEVETDKAIEFLEGKTEEKPFFMMISWNPPHPPYDQVPQKYVDLYNDEMQVKDNVPLSHRNPSYLKTLKEYYGAISGIDDQFGRLIKFLKEQDLYEDTVIVLSADHGEMMGAHGLMGKNIWYEESINIPLIIKGPDIIAGKTDSLLSSIDHMPTLLDYLEVDIPETVQGRSFATIFSGNKEDSETKEVFLSMIPGMPNLVEPYRQRGLNNKAYGWRGLRTKQHTYVVDNGCHPDDQTRRLIYDNHKDPLQLNPKVLHKDEGDAKAYDQILHSYLKEIKDPFLL